MNSALLSEQKFSTVKMLGRTSEKSPAAELPLASSMLEWRPSGQVVTLVALWWLTPVVNVARIFVLIYSGFGKPRKRRSRCRGRTVILPTLR